MLAKINEGASHEAIAELLERPFTSIRSRLTTLSRHEAPAAGRPKPPAVSRPAKAVAVSFDDEAGAMPKKSVEERPGVRIITHRIA